MVVQAKMFDLPIPTNLFGTRPDVSCKIRGPGGWKCRSVVQMKEQSNDHHIYGVSFVPRLEGAYKVQVMVNKSPYQMFDIEVTPRNDENSRPSSRPSPRAELRKQQERKLSKIKRSKSNKNMEESVQMREKGSSKRGNLRHRNTIPSFHNAIAPASDASGSPSGSPSSRQARKKTRKEETVKRCCVCMSPVKKGKECKFEGRQYCKTDFSNLFLSKRSFFGLGSKTSSSADLTLKGLSFDDVKRAQKYFAEAESFEEGRVVINDGHKIVRHMLKKKLKVSPLTPVMKDRVRAVLEQTVKSNATMTEREMLKILSVVASEYTRTMTMRGKRTVSKNNIKEVNLDADDEVAASTKNEQFVAGKFVAGDDDDDDNSDEDKGFFTGDKRADGWMLY